MISSENQSFFPKISCDWLHVALLFLFAALSLAGCSSTPAYEEEKIAERPKPTVATKPVVKREPGSLWSEDSAWNSTYAFSPYRSIGEVLVIKIDPTFKARVMSKLDKITPKEEEAEKPKDEKAKDKDKEKADEGKTAAAPPGKGESKGEESTTIRATIVEVHPRGIYTISANDILKFGDREPRVMVEGTVRDRDIQSNDMIDGDGIQNLKIEVQRSSADKGGKGL